MAGPCPRASESAYVRSHVGYGALTGDRLTKYIHTTQMNKETQSLLQETGFEIRNKIKVKLNQAQNQ